MNEEYSLENLVKNFKQTSVEYRQHHADLVAQWKIDYPNEALPEHFKNIFDLPMALGVICEEIIKLKDKKGQDYAV